MENFKWRTLIGLAVIYAAVFLNIYWLWIPLFWFWAIQGLLSNTAYFVEPIERKTHPVWFWIITLSWFIIGAYMLVPYLFPQVYL